MLLHSEAVAVPRQSKDQMRRAGPSNRTWILVVAMIVLAGLILWLARSSPPEDRAGNLEAFGLEDDPYLGDPAAPIVLVAYESPHCSNCQAFHQEVLPGIKERHIDTGQAVMYYIQGTIGGDMRSSMAQECIHRHGGNDAFWWITDRLYSRDITYNEPDWDLWFNATAQAFDLDAQVLVGCLATEETADAVEEDLRIGRMHDQQGTPTFWAFTEKGTAKRLAASEVAGHLASLEAK